MNDNLVLKILGLFLVLIALGIVIFRLCFLLFPDLFKKSEKAEAITRCLRLVSEMVGSLGNSGCLQATLYFDQIKLEMAKYGFTTKDFGMINERQLAELTLKSYRRGIAKLKLVEPKDDRIVSLYDAKNQFRDKFLA